MTDPVAEARTLLAKVRADEWSLHRGYDGITMASEMSDSDAAFIAAAPRLLAALADEVERLRSVADAARRGDDVALMDALNVADPSAATDLDRIAVPRTAPDAMDRTRTAGTCDDCHGRNRCSYHEGWHDALDLYETYQEER